MTVQTLTMDDIRGLAQQLRVDSIRCSTSAGSGHPTSSMSAADLMAVLLTRHFRYDWQHPDDPANDHLIFSKGHASPLLYSMFKAANVVTDDELVNTYRRFGSSLEGHPTPLLPWVDVATGSLGQGLPDGVGVALAGRYLDDLPYRVWVLCGDSELAEGSIWEAFDKAVYYHLSNLTVIVDVNRLGQRGPTELGWDMDAYVRRIAGFGCEAIAIDGHDLGQIDEAMARAAAGDRPTVILAHTLKGRGFSEVEDREGWHGRPLPAEMAERAIVELGGERHVTVAGTRPQPGKPRQRPDGQVVLPRYEIGAKVATRLAFGQALAAVGARSRVVALDGEVGNSTHFEEFGKAHPERYFEMFIAEQQLVAAAVGMSVRGYVPFAGTFAAFFTRAYDFIRMSAISAANIRLCGSHAGVEIGADGPSQMALEDLAMFRAVHGSTVLYPSDATSTASLVRSMADRDGVVYMRTTRGAYPVIYGPAEEFPIGGAKVVRASKDDLVTLIGAGVTLHNCLAAADELAGRGIPARVVDLYSVRPIDTETLLAAAAATRDRVIVVEDHYPAGGLGSAVLEAFSDAGHPIAIKHLAVRGLPGSGTPAELMQAAGISVGDIARAASEATGK
jgi:transketolase